MGFTEVHIGTDGEFTGQGKLPSVLENIQQQSPVEILRKLVSSFVEVQRSYGIALQSDGRMHGHERFDLISHLDGCMDLIITMRARFEVNEVFVMATPELGRRLQIHIDFDRWRATGSLGERRDLKANSFRMWLDRMTKERLPLVLKYFGEISRDGVFTPQELAGLAKLLDRLFFSIVIVREEIASGEVG